MISDAVIGTVRWPARREAYCLLAALMLASFFSFADRNIFNLLVPAIEHDLHISDTRISLLQGFAFALIYSLAALPFGWAADRFNRRNLIIAGMCFWCLATVLCGLANNFAQLFFARMLLGIGEAALIPAATSMLADSFAPEQRGRVLGLFTGGLMLGSGTAQFVGGLVLQTMQHLDTVELPFFGVLSIWQASFVWIGAPGLLVALLLGMISEPARPASITLDHRLGATWHALWLHARTHRMTLFYVLSAYTSYTFVSFAILNWAPTLFIRKYGVNAGQAGLLIGGIAVSAGALGVTTGGALGDKWSLAGTTGHRFRLLLIWSLTIAPLTVCYTVFNNLYLAVAAYFVMFFIQSMCYGSAAAVVHDCVPIAFRGRAVAIWYLVTGLVGYCWGPTATAVITDRFFHDREALPYSMLLVAIPGAALTFLLTWFGLRPFDRTRTSVMQGERHRMSDD